MKILASTPSRISFILKITGFLVVFMYLFNCFISKEVKFNLFIFILSVVYLVVQFGHSFYIENNIINIKQFFFLSKINCRDIISTHTEYVLTTSWIPPYIIKYKSSNRRNQILVFQFLPYLFQNSSELISYIEKNIDKASNEKDK